MICPKCGNNDVTDPEVCPKCHTVLKINNEKIGYKNQWNKNNYIIKKDKDINTIKSAITMVILLIIIGIVIAIGMKLELFTNMKTVELSDANVYFNNINNYIIDLNEKETYTINNNNYIYFNIPLNNCVLENNMWNNNECEDFMDDMDNYCKLKTNSCVRTPDSANITFDNNKIKNGSFIKYDNITCTYNDNNEIKCIQKK